MAALEAAVKLKLQDARLAVGYFEFIVKVQRKCSECTFVGDA